MVRDGDNASKNDKPQSGASDSSTSTAETAPNTEDQEKGKVKGQQACGEYLKRWQLWYVAYSIALSLSCVLKANFLTLIGAIQTKTGSLTTWPTRQKMTR